MPKCSEKNVFGSEMIIRYNYLGLGRETPSRFWVLKNCNCFENYNQLRLGQEMSFGFIISKNYVRFQNDNQLRLGREIPSRLMGVEKL